VLCLIAVPLLPGKNPFSVKIIIITIIIIIKIIPFYDAAPTGYSVTKLNLKLIHYFLNLSIYVYWLIQYWHQINAQPIPVRLAVRQNLGRMLFKGCGTEREVLINLLEINISWQSWDSSGRV
jgi:hypothetical protein